MTSDDRPCHSCPQRRRRWLWVAGGLAGVVVAGVVGVLMWFHSDADLERVQRSAAEAGLPLDWDDLDLREPTAGQRQAWQRIKELVGEGRSLQAYEGSQAWADDGHPEIVVGRPLPRRLRDFHAQLDDGLLREFEEAVDALGVESIDWGVDYLNLGDVGDYITAAKAVQRLLVERVLVAEDVTILEERAIRSLNFVSAQPQALPIFILNQASMYAMADASIRYQLGRLVSKDGSTPALQGALMRRLERFYPAFQRSLRGDLIYLRHVVEQAEADPLLRQFRARLEREEAFREQMAMIRLIESHQDFADLIGDERIEAFANQAVRYDESGPIDPPVFGDIDLVICGNALVRPETSARLLLAELQGLTWPIDPTAGPNERLRAILVDGEVIAAYMLKDGHDDGGEHGMDFVFELYGSVEHADPDDLVTAPAPTR